MSHLDLHHSTPQQSPVSPSSTPAASHSTLHKLPGLDRRPLSPPLSISAFNVHDSGSSSPQSQVFTPGPAPLMSAQTSQQGFTPASLSPSRDVKASISAHVQNDGNEKKDNLEDNIGMLHDPSRTSSKRRIAEEDDLYSEPTKRQRTDDVAHPNGDTETRPSPLYKLGTTPIPRSRPHVTDDFFTLYGLMSIQARFAREDPQTGEKQKLRKTYKGKMLDLPGKNMPTSKPGEMQDYLNYPDEEWYIQKEHGKELVKKDARGVVDETYDPADPIMSKLGSALKMLPGRLTDKSQDAHWSNFLEHDDIVPPRIATSVPTVKPKLQAGQAHATTASDPIATAALAQTSTNRPVRSQAKRKYDDDTYEGYSAEYGDGIESDGDGDGQRRKPTKRGRSNPPSATASPRFAYGASNTGVTVGSYGAR